MMPYYVDGLQILDVANCWYVVEECDYNEQAVRHQPLQMTIAPMFFKQNRHKILNDPTSLIDEYYKARPKDFGESAFEDCSFYDEITRFKENHHPKYVEKLNMHFTVSFLSMFDATYYIFKMQMSVLLTDNHRVKNYHLGMIAHEKRDVISTYVFDDVKYLNNNFDKDLAKAVYLKFLSS